MARNARFWLYWGADNFVKLTLREGQTLRAFKSWTTEEGWGSRAETFEHEGEIVRRESVDDGVDCDGRLTRVFEGFCSVAGMANGNTIDGVTFPKWDEIKSRQYDYQAIAAGY
jgi:hypothetical protein